MCACVCVGQLNWKMELKCESQLQQASQLENIAKKDSRRLRKKIDQEGELAIILDSFVVEMSIIFIHFL